MNAVAALASEPDLLPPEGGEGVTADPDEAAADLPVWQPLLASLGHGLTHGVFRRWWARWRRRSVQDDTCQTELARLAERGLRGDVQSPATPSPELRAWLASVGGPTELIPAAARRWLSVWLQLRRAERLALLPNRLSGPTAAKDEPSR